MSPTLEETDKIIEKAEQTLKNDRQYIDPNQLMGFYDKIDSLHHMREEIEPKLEKPLGNMRAASELKEYNQKAQALLEAINAANYYNQQQ